MGLVQNLEGQHPFQAADPAGHYLSSSQRQRFPPAHLQILRRKTPVGTPNGSRNHRKRVRSLLERGTDGSIQASESCWDQLQASTAQARLAEHRRRVRLGLVRIHPDEDRHRQTPDSRQAPSYQAESLHFDWQPGEVVLPKDSPGPWCPPLPPGWKPQAGLCRPSAANHPAAPDYQHPRFPMSCRSVWLGHFPGRAD